MDDILERAGLDNGSESENRTRGATPSLLPLDCKMTPFPDDDAKHESLENVQECVGQWGIWERGIRGTQS